MKRLAVLMPVYNTKEDFLRASIESILNQTYKDFDFYIINDGSTDKNVEKIISSYKDKRIIFINNKTNKGIAKTLNQGLDLCKNYEYIARMDSDDISLPNRFAKQIKYLDKNRDVGVLGTGFKIIPKNQVILPAQNYTQKNLLSWRLWISHPTVMFRTNILNKFNLRYNPNYEYAEDYELWTRIIDYTKINNIQEVLLHYRLENHNISNIKKREQLYLMHEIKTNLKNKITTKHIPIFLASNDNYTPFIATTIASIVYNTDSFCEFYILDSGISDLNKKRIEKLKEKFLNFSIEFLPIDLKFFKNFSLLERTTSDTYSRYLIPLLKPNLDKVIYLDADIIVLGNIKEFFDIELGEKYLGAIPENLGSRAQARIAKNIDIELLPNKNFFNAGVLLINNKKWIENNIPKKLFKLQKKYNKKLTYNDQDILNKQFYYDYLELDVKFNLTTSQILYKKYFKNISVLENAIQKPFIRHFTSPSKPWLTKYHMKMEINNFEDFWFFAKMTDFYNDILMIYKTNNNKTQITNKEVQITNSTKNVYKLLYNYDTIFIILLICSIIFITIKNYNKKLYFTNK